MENFQSFSLTLRALLAVALGMTLTSCSQHINAEALPYEISIVPSDEYKRIGIPVGPYEQFGDGLIYHGKVYVLGDAQEIKFAKDSKLPGDCRYQANQYYQSIPLARDKYLFVGGHVIRHRKDVALPKTWIVDANLNRITSGPTMHDARCKPLLLQLSNGQILIAGGNNGDDDMPIDSIEVYDPATNTMKFHCRAKSERFCPLNALRNCLWCQQ